MRLCLKLHWYAIHHATLLIVETQRIKIKVADVKTAGQMRHFLKKKHAFLEQPNKDFGPPCFIRALQLQTHRLDY